VDSVQRLSIDPRGSQQFHTRLRLLRITLITITVVAIGYQLVMQFL
jgi:hypothetical protein